MENIFEQSLDRLIAGRLLFGAFRPVKAALWPLLRVSDDVPMTDEARKEMNEWLERKFGYDCAVPRGEFLLVPEKGVVLLHPSDFYNLPRVDKL